MTNNPYQPPQAAVERSPVPVDVPEDIAKKIRNCWVAGLISIAVTLIFMLVAIGGVNPLGMSIWSIADIVVMSALTFGVYKKSRVCAILLLSQFLLNKVIMWSQSGQASGLPLALVFIWFYAQGVLGTFQYRKLARS